jgi:hypothetical protein
MRKKGLNKSKTVFSKCVLDLNFAYIQVEVFTFLKKNFKIHFTLLWKCKTFLYIL